MSAHEPVALDAAAEIRELNAQGIGRNKISHITGIPASTVRNVLDDKYHAYTDKLTPRQRQKLIMGAFGHYSDGDRQ